MKNYVFSFLVLVSIIFNSYAGKSKPPIKKSADYVKISTAIATLPKSSSAINIPQKNNKTGGSGCSSASTSPKNSIACAPLLDQRYSM